MTPSSSGLGWSEQRRAVRLYVGAVIAAGAVAFVVLFPVGYPRPLLFATLLVLACITSAWKVNLPIALSSGKRFPMRVGCRLVHASVPSARHTLTLTTSR